MTEKNSRSDGILASKLKYQRGWACEDAFRRSLINVMQSRLYCWRAQKLCYDL